jgi:hypothetical protein
MFSAPFAISLFVLDYVKRIGRTAFSGFSPGFLLATQAIYPYFVIRQCQPFYF